VQPFLIPAKTEGSVNYRNMQVGWCQSYHVTVKIIKIIDLTLSLNSNMKCVQAKVFNIIPLLKYQIQTDVK